jgi:hypothetical protein
MVELHWKTDPDYPVERVDDEGWWATLPMASVEGQAFRRFPDEELLLVLCLHATRHHGHRLGWIAEIAELIRRQPALDWHAITRRADALGASRRLHVALVLASEQLGAPVPSPVLKETRQDPAVGILVDQIAARLFRTGVGELTSADRLGMSLRFYQRASERFKHLLDVAFSPSLHEWSRWPLPRPLFALYLPLRLLRLAGKYREKLAGRD